MTLVSPIWNDILALILFYLSLRKICTEKSVQWYEKKSVKNYLDTVLREKIKYSVFSFTSEWKSYVKLFNTFRTKIEF